MPLRTAMFHFTSYIGRNSDKKQIVRREVQLYLVAPKSLFVLWIGMLFALACSRHPVSVVVKKGS